MNLQLSLLSIFTRTNRNDTAGTRYFTPIVTNCSTASARLPGLLVILAPPLHMFVQLRGTYSLGKWLAISATMRSVSPASCPCSDSCHIGHTGINRAFTLYGGTGLGATNRKVVRKEPGTAL